MVVGGNTFASDLAAHLGLDNCFANSPERYPHTSIEAIIAAQADIIVLPDEPYRFHPDDGPEAFPEHPHRARRRSPAHLVRPVTRGCSCCTDGRS